MRITILIAAAALVLAVPAQAKAPWVKKAKDLGIADVKDCNACHVGNPKKGGELTARGKVPHGHQGQEEGCRVRYGLAEGLQGQVNP